MSTMIALVGQQPIPNLLPIRHLQPARVLLVYTDFTASSTKRLADVIGKATTVELVETEAYSITGIRDVLLEKTDSQDDLLFNLTGGTKAMSLAAFMVAVQRGAPFLYFQSQGRQSLLYNYRFDAAGVPVTEKPTLLPALINADDYLRAYVGSYHVTGYAKSEPGRSFEQAVHRALQPVVDELLVGISSLGALDIDMVVRCANQVGIVEVKTGKNGMKKSLDQLNTAGGQQYLGTYTQKIVVSDQSWSKQSNLRELAAARRIEIIELPSYQSGILSPEDETLLQQRVCQLLGKSLVA